MTERTMPSYFGAIYDPLEIISPTMAEGKHSYWLALISRRVGILKDHRFKRWNRNIETMQTPRRDEERSSSETKE